MCEDRERWYEYGIGYLSAITLLPGEDHSVVFTFGRSDITKGFLEAAREEIAELKKRHVLIRGVERGVHVRSLSNDRVTAVSTKFNCEPTTASNVRCGHIGGAISATLEFPRTPEHDSSCVTVQPLPLCSEE